MAKKLDVTKHVRFRADDGESFHYVGSLRNGNLLFEVDGIGVGYAMWETTPAGKTVDPVKYQDDKRFDIINGPSDGSWR